MCCDLALNHSPEDFYKLRNNIPFERNTLNFDFIYLDNRKELLCIGLDSY